MPPLTHAEAIERATLLDVGSCDVTLDLTSTPARSRTELRFGCRRPGAATFADLTGGFVTGTLNGAPVGPPEDGRLALPDLAADNVLIVDAEVADRVLSRHPEHLLISSYPAGAADLFACFDQPDIGATTTLTLTAPADWDCIANGPVAERAYGTWRFAPVRSMVPFEFAVCAGPFSGNNAGLWYRRGLAGSAGALGAFDKTAREALRYYEDRLGVRCPYPKYDIVFHPELSALAISVPGLMVVNESLIERMSDPDDDFAVFVARHEVAHQWFGCLVGMRWFDDLWLDEAMATFVSYPADTDWLSFSYRDKERSYHADEMPGSVPVSSPVETKAQSLDRPPAITYIKGAAAVRQLAALIGEDAVYRGLNDYLTRFTVSAGLEDLTGCWSRASGRDLSGWADEWLRTTGPSTLRLEGGAVVQDNPRTHRIGVGLYDLDGNRLRHRRTILAEISGPRTELPEVTADAVILNDGDLTFARVGFDERTFAALRTVAMNTGDPLTESVCWTTAWHMMTAAELPAREFVTLLTRRLPADPPLPLPGLEVLTGRAVAAADRWAPRPERAVLRELLATTFFDYAERRTAAPPVRRALAEAFAASAQTREQLATLRDWLAQDWPDIPLRWKFLAALSARGLASDTEIGALAARDPAGGETGAADCRARRPDPAAKDAAWSACLATSAQGRGWMARAHAQGIWAAGQEDVLRPFRDRYFGETLPLLISRADADPAVSRDARRLAVLLFPATLAEEATVSAVGEALRGQLTTPMRNVLREQELVLRTVIEARSTATSG